MRRHVGPCAGGLGPTLGSLKPTSSEAVATIRSAFRSTPASWDDVRPTRSSPVFASGDSGRSDPLNEIPGLAVPVPVGLCGAPAAQPAEHAAWSRPRRLYRPAALGVTQVVVEPVSHVQVVGEQEADGPCRYSARAGPSSGRRASRPGSRWTAGSLPDTGSPRTRQHTGGPRRSYSPAWARCLQRRPDNPGQLGEERLGVAQCGAEAHEGHGGLADTVPPPAQEQRDLRAVHPGVGVHLIEQDESRRLSRARQFASRGADPGAEKPAG